MRNVGLVMLGILCAAIMASAQPASVTGIVVDARTGRPLSAVAVAIEGAGRPVSTDDDGRFQLTLDAGEYVLTASLVGYVVFRQALVVAAPAPPLTIALHEGAGSLEEHVIVAAGAEPTAPAAPAAMSLYGRELQALRGVTLDDPLRAVQSLPSAASTDDFYAEFAVRGSPFRHIGLVVDGVPSTYMMHAVHGVSDGGSIAMVNSDSVGSVSIVPGSFPQTVGRRLGAQVGLELREGDRERFRARVGLSGTSATAVAEGPLMNGRGSWLVSGRRSYLDLLLERIDEANSFAFGFTDGEAKLVFDVTPRHHVQILAIAGGSHFEEDPDDLTVNDEAEVNGRTWLSSATWRFTPSPRIAVTQRVYATGLAHTNTNREGSVLDDFLSADAGWRVDAVASLAPMATIEFGGDAQRLSGRHARRRALNDGFALTDVNDYRKNGGAGSAYAQVVLGRGSRLSVAPGIRLDRWGPTRTVASSPWAAATLAITGSTRIHAGGGTYRQFATLEQIHGVRGGGTDLEPERAHHIDVGVSQQLPLGTALQVNWYARDEREVLWTPEAEPRRLPDGSIQTGRGDARWANRLDGRARGVELVLRRDAPAGVAGWIGYAFGRHRSTDVASGETFWSDFDQRHALSVFGHYRVTARTAVSAKFRYGSNYPLTGYIGEQPFAPDAPPLFGGLRPLFHGLAESRNMLRLPAYARLDVRVDRTFTWAGRRITLFGEVANALDRQNLRNVPYGVDRAGRVQGATDTLLPLVPSAGFVIDF